MTKIKNYVDMIDDELCSAKDYAEMYLELKADNNQYSQKFKQMSEQELSHATILHDFATEEINELSSVYTTPTEMKEEWDKSHKKYIEKVAWIKQMLTM